jgi:hypothetical protein
VASSREVGIFVKEAKIDVARLVKIADDKYQK